MSNGEYHLDNFSGACKKKNWNIKIEKSQERSMQIDLKKRTQNVKTFLLYIDAHQRASAIKEAINYQVNKIIWPIVAEMEKMHRLNSMDCYSPTLM